MHARITITGANTFSKLLLANATLQITEFPFRIGRESRRLGTKRKNRFMHSVPNNDLYLWDSPPYTIDREHMQIEFTSGEYFVRDRGSLTGTLVNGHAIGGEAEETMVPLRPGENLIVLGGEDSPFRFILLIQ